MDYFLQEVLLFHFPASGQVLYSSLYSLSHIHLLSVPAPSIRIPFPSDSLSPQLLSSFSRIQPPAAEILSHSGLSDNGLPQSLFLYFLPRKRTVGLKYFLQTLFRIHNCLLLQKYHIAPEDLSDILQTQIPLPCLRLLFSHSLPAGSRHFPAKPQPE